MAKKKQPEEEARKKVSEHRKFTTKVSKDFFVNSLLGSVLVASADGPDPFTFVITIDIIPGLTIKSINVNGVMAKENDFKVSGSKITCEVKAFVSTFNFLLIIEAEGTSNTSTTFNLTCDKKKVFDKDQEIVILSTGRGGFAKSNVPLP
ncbi:hypothetical protein [Fibrisoma limi]|uniref:hypothetical protein n=1 Tax=Fibrisoma limi TaxID=663275 RepID=UPI000586EC98|nr:hypothetical protein [Fibrisoma limi]